VFCDEDKKNDGVQTQKIGCFQRSDGAPLRKRGVGTVMIEETGLHMDVKRGLSKYFNP
jgi:hypothetical protein